MSELYDNAIEKIGRKFCERDRQTILSGVLIIYEDNKDFYDATVKRFLKSIPELGIIDRNFQGEHSTTHCDMLKQGFVKEVKDNGK